MGRGPVQGVTSDGQVDVTIDWNACAGGVHPEQRTAVVTNSYVVKTTRLYPRVAHGSLRSAGTIKTVRCAATVAP